MSERPCDGTWHPEEHRALDRCHRCGHFCSDHARPPKPIDYKAECARLRAENASLLARLEQAERDNDALRGQLATRTEALQTANATVAATRADRDAWKAKAEARLDVSPEDAEAFLMDSGALPIDRFVVIDDMLAAARRARIALRDHARKSVTG